MTLPGLVYAQPTTPPIPPEVNPGRYGVSLTLVPEDSELDSFRLTDDGGDNGIILMGGMRGLGKLDAVAFEEEYAGRDGSYYFGERFPAREVFLPLHVFHDGTSLEWLAHDRSLFANFRRGRHCWLVAQLPTGETRRLRIRYKSGADLATDKDPLYFGFCTYGLYFTANQPLWEGDPIVEPWAKTPQLVMFGPSNPNPYINIASRSISESSIRNPGDASVWPIWQLEGPMASGAALTVDGGVITVPFALLDGDVLVIDTRPEEQTAILNGVTDKTTQLGSFGFREVPPGESVPVGISIPGLTGAVSLSITPLYERAW